MLLCNELIMYILSWLFTDKIQPLINRKPFNCRECMAFWLTCIGGILIALLVLKRSSIFPTIKVLRFGRLMVMGIAVVSGLLNYLYIKSKFKIYD